jgi:DtxR family Mn-dependent transcriptional regulator
VVQDYLKAIWTATEWGGEPITTTGLARRFGTSNATVSAAMRRLADAGLVAYQPYKPVTLSVAGVRYATQMVRKHRLIETFLAEVLGYPWTAVHAEAERLEHAASADFIDRIDAYLGHPERDPHGDAIDPATTTAIATPRLDAAAPGRYRVLRVSDADSEALNALEGIGLIPGARVEVIQPRERRVESGETHPQAGETPFSPSEDRTTPTGNDPVTQSEDGTAARTEEMAVQLQSPTGTHRVPAGLAAAVWLRRA